MYLRRAFEQFAQEAARANSLAELQILLRNVTVTMGYDHFALNHHVDRRLNLPGVIQLHNYPAEWVDFFRQNGLAICKIVQRAAENRCRGFSWSALGDRIMLMEDDLQVLETARRLGICDSYTVPLLMPGEYFASCSFVLREGHGSLTPDTQLAELVAPAAFDEARRIHGSAGPICTTPLQTLTTRQRDAAVLVAMGKSDLEGAGAMGISRKTFRGHLSDGFQRFGVFDRTSFAVRALRMGAVSYAELRL